MKKLLGILLLLVSTTASAEPLGEMLVSWTLPDNMGEVPYSTFEIKYVDSAGANQQVSITDLASTSFLVTGVLFGDTTVWMTSTCASCTTTESENSNVVDHTIMYNGTPQSPGNVTVTVTVTVTVQ